MLRFGFCDIRNNQGLGKCYQPRPYLDLTSTLIIPDITKTSPNNCFSYRKPPLIPVPTNKPHHLLPQL